MYLLTSDCSKFTFSMSFLAFILYVIPFRYWTCWWSGDHSCWYHNSQTLNLQNTLFIWNGINKFGWNNCPRISNPVDRIWIFNTSGVAVCKYLTTRFHVAMCPFSNRSQMTSKCGKNKKVAQGVAECVTDVLSTFWHFLWSITEQVHGNMESSCFIQQLRNMLAEFGLIFVTKQVRERAKKSYNLVNLTTSNNSRTNFIAKFLKPTFIPFVNSWKPAEFSRVRSTFINYFQHDKTDKQISFAVSVHVKLPQTLYLFRFAVNFNLRQLIYKPSGMIADDHRCNLWLCEGATMLN